MKGPRGRHLGPGCALQRLPEEHARVCLGLTPLPKAAPGRQQWRGLGRPPSSWGRCSGDLTRHLHRKMPKDPEMPPFPAPGTVGDNGLHRILCDPDCSEAGGSCSPYSGPSQTLLEKLGLPPWKGPCGRHLGPSSALQRLPEEHARVCLGLTPLPEAAPGRQQWRGLVRPASLWGRCSGDLTRQLHRKMQKGQETPPFPALRLPSFLSYAFTSPGCRMHAPPGCRMHAPGTS